ncbi:hypothetical protein BVX93_01830 [bacterium B13(2017)]|nr:hypothetical protein BVX93_01830 [bacterium B13(2017)]
MLILSVFIIFIFSFIYISKSNAHCWIIRNYGWAVYNDWKSYWPMDFGTYLRMKQEEERRRMEEEERKRREEEERKRREEEERKRREEEERKRKEEEEKRRKELEEEQERRRREQEEKEEDLPDPGKKGGSKFKSLLWDGD